MNEHVQTGATDPLFNPLSPDFIRDPYAHYEQLRTTDLMHITAHGVFVASRHAEVSLVLRDRRFGKDYVERIIRRYGSKIIEEPIFRSAAAVLRRRHSLLPRRPAGANRGGDRDLHPVAPAARALAG